MRRSLRHSVVVFLAVLGSIRAQMSNSELARETSDPTSDLWYLYTETAFGVTPARAFRDSNQFTLELQPSMPVPLTRSLKLLNLPDLVFATQGIPAGTQVTGVDSFSWLAALSPVSKPGALGWGIGPYVSMPVSTDQDIASSQWQFGGGGILSWRSQDYVTSVLAKGGWTAAGVGDEAGSLQIQYNLQRFFGDGWQVGLGRPRIEYTWTREGSGSWDIPVGLDVARMFRIGSLPVKVMIEYDFFVINDSRWEPLHLIRLTILPVLPGPFKEPILK